MAEGEGSGRRLAAVGVLILVLFGAVRAGRAADEVDFVHDVAPILREHCGTCHIGNQREGGFSLNTRQEVLAGADSGPVVTWEEGKTSELLVRVTTDDEGMRMPPEGDPLTPEQVAVLRRWIEARLPWDDQFRFVKPSYEPPLRPRRPELPQTRDGRSHPVDRILDAYLERHGIQRPEPVSDAAFLRRAHLDLIGLLPTPAELDAFQDDSDPDKREKLIDELLSRKVDYSEHWLTFWNDLLRNDYTGTGFITGGRKQITAWLYSALLENKPYDRMVRELIDASPESEGFRMGIRWRGDINSSQTVEVQFAQNLSQAFLGINIKCASCHDSFVDRWKLDEAYGLAAVVAESPLEIHRCDKPTGQMAEAAWVFPELGEIDSTAPQPERLRQLAELITHEENGRLTRTIVNRFWHRLMGRGIVHPTDAMDSEPWSEDLLDHLAIHLADHAFDLKATIRYICTSRAYQCRIPVLEQAVDADQYVFRGPVARRLTAEQFLDAVWQLTGGAPKEFDAPLEEPDDSENRRANRRGSGRRGDTNRAGDVTDRDENPAPAAESLVEARGEAMVRASLLKSDFLMRSLGRPNRDQIVSMRPAEFTTLEAIDLANGEPLIQAIHHGAGKLQAERGSATDEMVDWLYRFALSRQPTDGELALAREVWGTDPSEADVEDLIWAVIMLPEFQWIR
jgi:mono/diheme cytochrome c family protein